MTVDLNRLREFLQEKGEQCKAYDGQACDCLFCLVDAIELKLSLQVCAADSRALEFAQVRPFAWRV